MRTSHVRRVPKLDCREAAMRPKPSSATAQYPPPSLPLSSLNTCVNSFPALVSHSRTLQVFGSQVLAAKRYPSEEHAKDAPFRRPESLPVDLATNAGKGTQTPPPRSQRRMRQVFSAEEYTVATTLLSPAHRASHAGYSEPVIVVLHNPVLTSQTLSILHPAAERRSSCREGWADKDA